jgi:hypothetical protein
MYASPISSNSIFCTMKIATVLLSSEPVSIMRRQSGMISVVRRKLITSDESFFTSAPITPRDVRRRYSKGRDLEVVLRKGYKKSGICARIGQQNC